MTPPSTASKARNHGHHVLIVDDEEIVLVALRETLRQEGYDVVTAQDAVQALAELQKRRFSIIITDQQMPSLTGLEFLSQVRLLQPGTICSSDMSHMPLWLAPSSPVIPARSRTNVTPALCRAQSMSTWSKARLMNVA